MTTQAQINANRINAQKSTGPKTPEGKAIAAQNSTIHGLRSTSVLAPTEDPAEFETHRQSILDDLAPVGSMETFYAERIVTLSWHLARAARLQSEMFNTLALPTARPRIIQMPTNFRPANIDEFAALGMTHRQFQHIRKTLGTPGLRARCGELIKLRQEEENQKAALEAAKVDNSLAAIAERDFRNHSILDRLINYERRIENSLFKTRRDLEDLQQRRRAKEKEQHQLRHAETRANEPNPTQTVTPDLIRGPEAPECPVANKAPNEPNPNNQSPIITSQLKGAPERSVVSKNPPNEPNSNNQSSLINNQSKKARLLVTTRPY